MRSLLFNLVAHARRFLMLTKSQLTFHLGDDRYWADGKFADYEQFNVTQARLVAEKLSRDVEKAKKLRDFILAHEHSRYH